MIKIIQESKKIIRNESGGRFSAYAKKTGDDWEIHIPYKASTKTKLHEIGHAKNNDEPIHTLSDALGQELSAELYAFDVVGKEIDIYRIIEIIKHSWHYADERSYKIPPHYIFNLSMESLRMKGLYLDRGQKSFLWNELIDHSKELKRKRRGN